MYHVSKAKSGKVSKGMIGIHQISVMGFLLVFSGVLVILGFFSSGKPPL
jgi:hypothetical protein